MSEASSERLDCDLLVVGGGMAGMTAAARAAASGVVVIVVEKAAKVGGSAAISGGHIWTTPSLEDLLIESPGSDRPLAELLIDRFHESVDWVRRSGTAMSDELVILGYGRGYRFDVEKYLRWCRAQVESAGGHVVTGRSVKQLIISDGRVAGGLVDEDGVGFEIRAPWTVLATGGFSASQEYIREFICPPENVLVRSTPGATGDGLRFGTASGAATTRSMAEFYGHLVAWPLRRWGIDDFIRLSYFYSHLGLLLDLKGQRFCDESHMDHCNAQAVAQCPDGRAVLIMDADMTASAVTTPAAQGMNRPDPFEEAQAAGAHAREFETLEALCGALSEWGFDGAAAGHTLRIYDAQVSAGATLAPNRAKATRFVKPPFRAAEVRSGITVTEGGLRIGADGVVLRPDGTRVEGLLAAGADVGGVFDGGYAGGLAAAATQALAAADTVAGSERRASR